MSQHSSRRGICFEFLSSLSQRTIVKPVEALQELYISVLVVFTEVKRIVYRGKRGRGDANRAARARVLLLGGSVELLSLQNKNGKG